MSYKHPTPLEIRISARLQSTTKWLRKRLERKFEGEIDLILLVTPKRTADNHSPDNEFADQPIMSYIATCDRESSTLVLCEMLMKWQLNQDTAPLHTLKDADGRTLAEILGAGPS